MGKTHYISDWEQWKKLCEYYGEDPHENVDLGFDLGGGKSRDFEYIGDIPEREED